MLDMLYTLFAEPKKTFLPGTRIHVIPVELLIAHALANTQNCNDKGVTDNHMLHAFHCAKKALVKFPNNSLRKKNQHFTEKM